MSPTTENFLFKPFVLGGRELRNRIVMAPMTRGRARNAGLVPTELHVEYYRQRASAGLIVTEATWVNRDGIGFINVPGLFTPEQVAGWRRVTDAVHSAGGTIFAQLAHSGSVSHPDFFEGKLPLAPSAVNPGLRSFTVEGFKETVTPRAMSIEDIEATIDDYVAAGRNARSAGFDGVEVHAGTTYLLPQFLNSALNLRDDAYGGSAENRSRIVLDILEKLTHDWGQGRVGIKISPTLAMGGFAPTDQTIATYDHLVERLNGLPLSHLHVVKAPNDLAGTPVAALQDTVGYFRGRFEGALIANFGFDKASANAAIEHNNADLVSFGKPFIGNPDLVRRLREDLPLSESKPETYYQGGAEGYVDYPPAAGSSWETQMTKVALVTGASSGIGQAIALQLAIQGVKTYGAARHTDRMTPLQEASVHPVQIDMTDTTTIDACVATIIAESGRVDILINVAGTALYGSVEEVPLAEARRLFEINLFGAATLIQRVAAQMRARRSGTIINITSVGRVIASPYGAWYHATKFALEGFSASLRQELSPFGVDVVIVRPEAIKTGWRAIAASTLLANSGDGPYAKATRAMHAKYTSPQFDKAVADPRIVADLIKRILSTRHPRSVYMVPRMAKVLLSITALMGSDRVRDAFVRKFIGLPKSM